MASIRERVNSKGERTYHVQVRVQGYPPQTKTFKSKSYAKQWAAYVESELREGRYLPRVEAQKHTVKEFLEKYRDEVLIPHKPKRAYDQGQQLAWWIDALGAYSLADLSPALIGQCRDRLLQEPIGRKKDRLRSPATVVRYMAVLSHALTIAVKEWEWLQESPMSKVNKPRVRNERTRFLSAPELGRLLDATKISQSRYLHLITLIAVSTGMRYSEIMHLCWKDVLFDDVGESALILLAETKNGERRGVPLVGEALAGLHDLRTLVGKANPDTFPESSLLFPSEGDAKKPVEIRKAWETALERAEVMDFRFHDLRHTAASYLAMDGATAPEIAEILGHKDLKMVRRYSHLAKEHLTKVVARMNKARLGQVSEVEEPSGSEGGG